MCLLVYCNGVLEVRGEFASVYVRVVSGQYDKKLNWPLRCRVEIDIRNVRKSTANTRIIDVYSQPAVPGERFSSQTKGSCPRALNLREGVVGYESISSYLKDGCLTIAVLRVIILG